MSTPTATPRTDNAWRRYNSADQPDPKELVKESSALETELAAALLRIKELEDDNDNLLMDLLEASK